MLQSGMTGLRKVAIHRRHIVAALDQLDLQRTGIGERGRFIYFDTHYHPGTVIELSEVQGPKGKMFRMIREASQSWDGRDPVRPFPDLSRL